MRQAHLKCYTLKNLTVFFSKDARFKFSILDYQNRPSVCHEGRVLACVHPCVHKTEPIRERQQFAASFPSKKNLGLVHEHLWKTLTNSAKNQGEERLENKQQLCRHERDESGQRGGKLHCMIGCDGSEAFTRIYECLF